MQEAKSEFAIPYKVRYNLTMNILENEETLIVPELIITRGISNSGKSTWAKEWLAANPENRRRINRDDLRAAALNISQRDLEEEKLITVFQHKAIRLHLKEKRSVVVDDMNLRAKFVKPLYEIALEMGAKFVVKPFPIALDVALKRAEDRSKDGGLAVPEDAIRDMFTRYTANGTPYPLPDFTKPSTKGRKSILENIQTYVPDITKPQAVIVDIDGTLTMGIHPDRGAFEWNKVGIDILNEHVADMVRLLHSTGYRILITSGRDNVCRPETMEWLSRHDVPYHEIFMRDNEDMAGDDVVKLEIFNEKIRDNYNIRAVFDDRLRVVRLWHSLGLPLFRIGDPDADF